MRCAVTGLRFMFCRHTISTWLSASKPKSCASPQSQNANPKRWSLWPVKSGGASFSARAIGRCVQPNPALKGRSNGVPPGPGHRYGVHCLWPGPGVPPLASPLARTLGSTLRYCGAPASKFKCSVCQPSVRFRSWRPFLAFAKFVATRSTCPASNAALTSFGVRESCAYRQKPKSLQLVAMHVSPVVGAKRPLLSASHRKASCQESSCGLFSVVAWCGESSVVIGAR
jgi:hypothetical protein